MQHPADFENWSFVDFDFLLGGENTTAVLPSDLLDQLNVTCGEDSGQHERFPTAAKIAAAITFPLIFVLGLIGNLLVIIVVFRNQKMQNTTHVLMVSLAFADLLFIAFCVPTTLADYIALESPFGATIMSIVHYVNYCTCYLSIYTLVLMSLDRFLAVVYATESRPYRTVRNTTLSVVALWPIICLSQTYMFVTEDETAACSDAGASTAKTLVFFLFGYLLPLILIVILYGAVIRRLFLSNVHQSERNLRSKRRAANLVVIVIGCFAGAYLPVHILFLYIQFWMAPEELDIILLVQVCSNFAAYMNSCINPILYAFLSRHFRDAFLQLFKEFSAFFCGCLLARQGRDGRSVHSSGRSNAHARPHAQRDQAGGKRKTLEKAAPEKTEPDSSDSSGESTPNDAKYRNTRTKLLQSTINGPNGKGNGNNATVSTELVTKEKQKLFI